jgi:hypothetical protein
LEQFSSFISTYDSVFRETKAKELLDRLEQPPPPPHAPVPVLNAADVFPVFALRSWQPPIKFQDLRFIRK